MKNEHGFGGLALMLEGFGAVIFAGVLASQMLAGQGKLGQMYNTEKFSPSNLVLMMDSKPALFNRYHVECSQGDILPDHACRHIRLVYEVNGPAI
ncbi:hypothetical protein A6M27_02855 [Acidithiobacillus thiooxidans]|uniref:Uncharacterized protein n=1 Tax=Acidithiobacillus thiooxidans TaxID=930 RepID=A0A1C2IPU5_ACITH|nr:hypothetical protein [Acidithiobacillus thiooxidans]OCX76240.1 hypothetical protein A6P07_02795 [Acidithiobacillus thiooxidans]OCX77955.1 hypothetical protein A6O24_05690 [Acidithiobacillus thiooxidans]OCX84910.1 hypothetical protein A6O26_02895 [Acidithiobacillus thiooxidans]OCX89289.1 hypothetical protein A6M27_02855 [Acidithiobacillus thiooxidans]OFC49101.1 hypothetical protein BAE47_05980 [Acidithiobacillus thiooxidans]